MGVGEDRDTSGRKHSSHVNPIPKGVTGDFSKLIEEFEEAKDAHTQGLPLMELWEWGDFFAAFICYLRKHYPSIQIEDVLAQAKHTDSLFARGLRKNQDGKV